jgi:O-antigen/teichoic acid export membrane protein
MTAVTGILAPGPLSSRASVLTRVRGAWRSDSVWSLVDQGVVSLGNFATTVIVIRGLSVQDTGLYSLLLDTTMFLNAVHAPILTYPLSIRGAEATKGTSAGRVAWASLSMTGLAGAMLLLVGVLAGLATGRLTPILLTAVAASAWQLQEVARRALIAQGRLMAAAAGDAISYLGQAIAVWFMLSHGAVTLDHIFIVMAVTSILALVFQISFIGLHTCSLTQLQSYASDFWNLGRWPLAGSLAAILTVPAFSWTLIYFHGWVAGAQNLALLCLLKASHPVMFAAMNLIIPSVARAKSQDAGGHTARRVFLKQATFGTMILLPYFAVLALFPAWVLNHAYHGHYMDCAGTLRVIVLSYALVYAANMTTAFLNGLGRTKAAFNGQLANTTAAAVIGLPLTAAFGLVGSAWGGGVAVLARLCANLVSLRRKS